MLWRSLLAASPFEKGGLRGICKIKQVFRKSKKQSKLIKLTSFTARAWIFHAASFYLNSGMINPKVMM